MIVVIVSGKSIIVLSICGPRLLVEFPGLDPRIARVSSEGDSATDIGRFTPPQGTDVTTDLVGAAGNRHRVRHLSEVWPPPVPRWTSPFPRKCQARPPLPTRSGRRITSASRRRASGAGDGPLRAAPRRAGRFP